MSTPPSDDLGHPVPLLGPARRVVSLVPSLTEAVAVTAPESLIGATDWCTHPRDLDVTRVRGTKNPNVRQIVELKPDLVIANQEENRELDVRRLREAGVNVWVTRINTVAESLTSMRRLFAQCFDAQPIWLDQADEVWAHPLAAGGRTIAVPIWKNPYIWVGDDTYAADVLVHLGFTNALAEMGRYPHVGLEHEAIRKADVITLPDEPYPFSPTDGPADFAEHGCGEHSFGERDVRPCEVHPRIVQLIEGRWLFWYGPAMVDARSRLMDALR